MTPPPPVAAPHVDRAAPVTTAPPRPGDEQALAWEIELDRLELDILRVERLLRAVEHLDGTAWQPPELSVPMPAHLHARAREIHERQARLVRDLTRALQRSGRQHSFASHVARATTPTAAPAYVDLHT